MPGDLGERLKQNPLFAELGEDDLRAVAKLVKEERYPTGSVICHQGEVGVTAYFVHRGELRVLHVDPEGNEQEVGRLGPGDYFGETSLLLGEPCDATVEVVWEATLLCLDKKEFDQLLEERPSAFEALQMRLDVAEKRRTRRFKWQDPDEVVVVHHHKHNAILVRNLLLPFFLLLLDMLACGYLGAQSAPALIAGALLAPVPVVIALYLAVDHFNDEYVVTNKRVVHNESVFLIRELRSEAPLRTIQDIQLSQRGLLARSLDFGDLIIETAGERGLVIFRQIPDPAGAQQAIFEQMRCVESSARAEKRVAIRDMLRRQLGGESGASSPRPIGLKPEAAPANRGFQDGLRAWFLAPVRLFRQVVPALRQEEEHIISWRKHWIALIRSIWLSTALIAAATLVAMGAVSLNQDNLLPVLSAYGMTMIILFPWWVWIFDDWKNDLYQVTRTRIIDVKRLPFYLREERREASLAKVQNISLEIPSLLGRVLNYGSVTIETAGAGAFTFDYVKDPRGVQAEIFRRVEAFEQQQRQREAGRRQAELLDWFSIYDQIRRPKPSDSEPPPSYQEES